MSRIGVAWLVIAASGCLLFEPFPDPAPTATTDAGPDASGLTPDTLPGLAMWLDASRGVITTVTGIVSWKDQALSNTPEQLDRLHQPTLRANAQNGLPAVHFGGNDQYLLAPDSPTLRFGTGDFLIELVVAYTNAATHDRNTGYGALFVKSSAYYPYTGPGLFANDSTIPNASIRGQLAFDRATHSQQTTLDDGSFHIVAMRRRADIVSVRVDGVTAGTGVFDDADVSAVGMGVYIGGRDPLDHSDQALRGDIAELIAVNGVLSDEQLAALEAYLRHKYAL